LLSEVYESSLLPPAMSSTLHASRRDSSALTAAWLASLNGGSHGCKASTVRSNASKAQSIANTKQMSVVPGEEFQDKNTSGPSSRLFCKDSEHVLLPAAGLESDASRLRTGTKQFPTWDSQVSEVVFGSELLNPGLPTVEFVGRFKGSAGQGSWERPCEEARMCPADSSRRLGLRRFPAARRRSESMEVFTHSTEEARMVTTVSPLRSDGLEPDFKKMFKDRAGKPSWVFPLEGKRTVTRPEMDFPEASLRLSPAKGNPTKRTWVNQMEAMLRLYRGQPRPVAQGDQVFSS